VGCGLSLVCQQDRYLRPTTVHPRTVLPLLRCGLLHEAAIARLRRCCFESCDGLLMLVSCRENRGAQAVAVRFNTKLPPYDGRVRTALPSSAWCFVLCKLLRRRRLQRCLIQRSGQAYTPDRMSNSSVPWLETDRKQQVRMSAPTRQQVKPNSHFQATCSYSIPIRR
jgi:hypothetical protein